MTKRLRLAYLIQTYIENKGTAEELNELKKLIGHNENEKLAKSILVESIQKTEPLSQHDENRLQAILSRISEYKEVPAKNTRTAHLRQKYWWAAAAVFIILCTGSYFLFSNLFNSELKGIREKTLVKDISPGGNKAYLTLADGSQIILDSAANGNLTNQGNTTVIKLDNQVLYKTAGKATEVLYNTITTPRGGIYQLALSDGTKVWLNSSSTLRFPTSFIGRERKVDISGEAYFEVSRNNTMPFIVTISGKEEVEVLGTHFNINAYPDEPAINTTLLEGSVKITGLTMHNSHIISPGQQAQMSTNGQIVVNRDADLEQVMAWKNGIFNFDNADLQTVLRQLSRWYSVDVVYEGAIPQREFEGEMQRDLNLSQVLRILEKNNVHFRIEGNKLVVMK